MNRPVNSGKRVESIDRFSDESSRSTESTKVESIDRVGRFSVELSRFVRLDGFQGLIHMHLTNALPEPLIMLMARYLYEQQWTGGCRLVQHYHLNHCEW